MIKKHKFSPGAMSIIQMGEELIGHPSTAINELVKNGYDADAESIKVYFHDSEDRKKSFAIIVDDGHGMEESTMFGDWLQPSVSTKRKTGKKSDKFKRHFLGSKGIGRLAAMALGEHVTVVSKTAGESLYNWITVGREDFRQEKLLSEIKFPGDQVDSPQKIFQEENFLEARAIGLNESLNKVLVENEILNFKNGTAVIVEVLDDAVRKILDVDFKQTDLHESKTLEETTFYKSLSTLLTPLTLNQGIQDELLSKEIIREARKLSLVSNNFDVWFSTNYLIEEENTIDWVHVEAISILSIYDYRIYGKVTSSGDVEAYLTYNRLEADKFEETVAIGRKDYVSKDDEPELFDQNKEYEVGEYYFDFRVYDIGENDNLEKLARLANLKNSKTFRAAFKRFQGLRVSKNGFGVKPYGEEVEDWIGLSKARVQNPGQNVNTNQILGYVYFFSPENDSLEEQTNREGFLNNKAFQQVKETLGTIFKVLGKKRYNYRLMHGLGRVPTSKHDRPDFDNYIQNIAAKDNISQVVAYSEKFMKEVSTSMDNLEDSLSFSERLAALGSGIELVYHEMAQPISGLRTTKSSLDLKKNKVEEGVRDIYINDINTLHHATDVLAQLRKSLQPAIGRTRKRKFHPYDTFFKVCNLYRSDLKDYKIEIKVDERLKSYSIASQEYAFWIAFLNIINNAVYWLKRAERGGVIEFFMENDSLVIANNGPLINEKILNYIFEYGVTTRQERNATGLGLAFTRSTLDNIGWDIEAENRNTGPAFIIKLTKDE